MAWLGLAFLFECKRIIFFFSSHYHHLLLLLLLQLVVVVVGEEGKGMVAKCRMARSTLSCRML